MRNIPSRRMFSYNAALLSFTLALCAVLVLQWTPYTKSFDISSYADPLAPLWEQKGQIPPIVPVHLTTGEEELRSVSEQTLTRSIYICSCVRGMFVHVRAELCGCACMLTSVSSRCRLHTCQRAISCICMPVCLYCVR